MHEPSLGLVHPGVVEVVEHGDHDLQHLAALEDVVEELLVVLAQLPEEDEQLLVEVDLLLGAGQVGLGQRVHQQPRDARQDEGEVLLPVDPGNQSEVSIEVR